MLSSLSKSKLIGADPLCLRATGANISQIDIVKPSFAGALKLYVSNNSIKTIENIFQFRSLEVLLITNNLISYIEDLQPLSKLKKLKIINLEGNPVSHLPLYKVHLLVLCPSLKEIDGAKVDSLIIRKKYSQNELESLVSAESALLNSILSCEVVDENISKIPPNKIRSVQFMIDSRYPEELIKQRYSQIRREFSDMPTKKYLTNLRAIFLKEHQNIYNKAVNENQLSQETIEKHKLKLEQLSNIDNFDQLTQDAIELTQIVCDYVEDPNLPFVKSPSKSVSSIINCLNSPLSKGSFQRSSLSENQTEISAINKKENQNKKTNKNQNEQESSILSIKSNNNYNNSLANDDDFFEIKDNSSNEQMTGSNKNNKDNNKLKNNKINYSPTDQYKNRKDKENSVNDMKLNQLLNLKEKISDIESDNSNQDKNLNINKNENKKDKQNEIQNNKPKEDDENKKDIKNKPLYFHGEEDYDEYFDRDDKENEIAVEVDLDICEEEEEEIESLFEKDEKEFNSTIKNKENQILLKNEDEKLNSTYQNLSNDDFIEKEDEFPDEFNNNENWDNNNESNNSHQSKDSQNDNSLSTSNPHQSKSNHEYEIKKANKDEIFDSNKDLFNKECSQDVDSQDYQQNKKENQIIIETDGQNQISVTQKDKKYSSKTQDKEFDSNIPNKVENENSNMKKHQENQTSSNKINQNDKIIVNTSIIESQKTSDQSTTKMTDTYQNIQNKPNKDHHSMNTADQNIQINEINQNMKKDDSNKNIQNYKSNNIQNNRNQNNQKEKELQFDTNKKSKNNKNLDNNNESSSTQSQNGNNLTTNKQNNYDNLNNMKENNQNYQSDKCEIPNENDNKNQNFHSKTGRENVRNDYFDNISSQAEEEEENENKHEPQIRFSDTLTNSESNDNNNNNSNNQTQSKYSYDDNNEKIFILQLYTFTAIKNCFKVWKHKFLNTGYKIFNQHSSSSLIKIESQLNNLASQIDEIEKGEFNTSNIHKVTERRRLLRQIETQKEINQKVTDRYNQLMNELKAKDAFLMDLSFQ